MDHLPWYAPCGVSPVRVPFICGGEALCGGDDFLEFPEKQEWQWKHPESLLQLARMGQAWLFFGLLGIVGISPEACISAVDDATSTIAEERWIDTSHLPDLLQGLKNPEESAVQEVRRSRLADAIVRAKHVMSHIWIPYIWEFDAQDMPTLWNSPSYAIIFSIEVLLDALEAILSFENDDLEKLGSKSLLAKFTPGIARSLLQVGKCGSLAYRLPFTASKLYHLMSLPDGSDLHRHNHSLCKETSCSLMNVDSLTYRTQHTQRCVACENLEIMEAELVRLIQRDEVPVIRSTMDSSSNLRVSIVKMDPTVDYVAISHVWAGGLGNFQANSLPHCQLQALHRDVLDVMICAYDDDCVSYNDASVDIPRGMIRKLVPRPQNPDGRAWFGSQRTQTTCYYWIDTLCIPVHQRDEKIRAINSMGRIYAGAANIVVLDPTLSRTNFSTLHRTPGEMTDAIYSEEVDRDGEDLRHFRANMLVDASPWMARSWPLQEAALASTIYVKFADRKFLYESSRLGISSTLQTLPNQESRRLMWGGDSLWSLYSDVLGTGEPLPHTPNTEFISVWNQLTRRTTSYPEDVPAIFAALLYRSAGELLSIAPQLRSRAILRCVESLPLDILTVDRDRAVDTKAGWVPRFPGSRERVPEIDLTHGVLERTANGFLVRPALNPSGPTRILICPSGVGVSDYILLRDALSGEAITLRAESPAAAFRGKLPAASSGPQLLLLLSKPCLQTPSWNFGILCDIHEHTKDMVKTRLVDTTITWKAERDPHGKLQHTSSDCRVLEDSCSIYIEMGMLISIPNLPPPFHTAMALSRRIYRFSFRWFSRLT
ncbi:hypothetical protein PFICI_15049 [Pestalotiopsis fici W106-1]|uniref:Heterokaryon incompatibility domain-containing protein n=1 Tax=Pestalotiopsis fici (strain W106-1 / CGMCC3.15140) TaxID=1229662 RepID=W3WI36_PESFW|nr:uncharacterized protein PFICI_15049 [Pestalotiopsis fici W106-1]ETS73444.1 hypothetical protein PFICI_15049 [Pestalotiopsis fici W106-1]